MKLNFHSYRTRLLVSFLVCALVPMFLCSFLLVRVIDLRLNRKNQEYLDQQMTEALRSCDRLQTGLATSAQFLGTEVPVSDALGGKDVLQTLLNAGLYRAAHSLQGYGTACLYNEAGELLASTGSRIRFPSLSPGWGILRAADSAGGSPVFRIPAQYESGQHVLLQGAVRLNADDSRPGGYLVLNMEQEDFLSLFRSNTETGSRLLIFNSFWHPVFAGSRDLWSETGPELRTRLLNGQAPGSGFAVRLHEPTGLYLVLERPLAFSRNTLHMMYAVSLGCAIFCVLIAIVFYLPMSRAISYPVTLLSTAFRKLKEDDLEVRLPTDRNDEVGQLAATFNNTVKALKQNREDLLQGQRELNQAQIRLLQTQLNPHFLCNTLDTMKWISKIHKVPEVAEMSANLADILRYCITAEEFVPLYRETAFLERYIEIQRIRMGDQFDFLVDLPEELSGAIVPKMILQPLVENAVIHGLRDQAESAVTVVVRTVGPMLQITVSDNGRGLPQELWGGRS